MPAIKRSFFGHLHLTFRVVWLHDAVIMERSNDDDYYDDWLNSQKLQICCFRTRGTLSVRLRVFRFSFF